MLGADGCLSCVFWMLYTMNEDMVECRRQFRPLFHGCGGIAAFPCGLRMELMKSGVLSILTAVVWAVSLGAQEPRPVGQTDPAPEQAVGAAQQGREDKKPLAPVNAGDPTDPAKMAAPKPEGRHAEAGGVVDPKAFVIGPEDVLAIRVWREPELSGQFVVRPDGKIAIPLVNEVMAAGLTPEQLALAIESGLDKYMRSPEVTISVMQVNSRKYYMQGEINKPGSYPLVVPTTVLEALVNAGGFREFANSKKIRILRGKDQLKFNYKEVTRGKNLGQNVLVQPGDQIIVP